MNCENCTGCSGHCGGCSGLLELTEPELKILEELAVYAFLPIAWRADDPTPFYPEGTEAKAEHYSAAILHLERKGLIDLDYGKPIGAYPPALYAPWPVHGSMALTARGQQILEALSVNGIE